MARKTTNDLTVRLTLWFAGNSKQLSDSAPQRGYTAPELIEKVQPHFPDETISRGAILTVARQFPVPLTKTGGRRKASDKLTRVDKQLRALTDAFEELLRGNGDNALAKLAEVRELDN